MFLFIDERCRYEVKLRYELEKLIPEFCVGMLYEIGDSLQ